jgi:hypothetical protein|uniref:Uncharacterized protein n=1 Tax=viral metagenome TaxID=1070528 RepID=A0A6C0IRZ7_9ZZZZ
MTSVRLLVVDKNGTIKESVLKNWDEDELYKKAGFKNSQGFALATTWNIGEINKKSYSIRVYGKTDGRATQENKYEFPPPIDETLFFGSCLIVNMRDDKPVSLTTAEWTCIYDKLYGGFEDLGEEESEEESDEYDDVPKTKSGYAKDGFIVDDDEQSDDDYEDSDVSDELEPLPNKKSNKKKTKSNVKTDTSSVPDNVFMELSNEIDEIFDSTKELEKEEYIS